MPAPTPNWVNALDYASLQAAVATGSPVYIPAGANLSAQDVVVTTPGQVIFGDGNASVVTQADITKHVFKVRADDVVLRNFRIDGILTDYNDTNAVFAVFTEQAYPAQRLRLDSLFVSGADASHGMHNFAVFDNGCDGGIVRGCHVERIVGGTVGGGNGYGVLMAGSRFLVEGNRFVMGYQRGRHGIYISAGASYGRVVDNCVSGSTYDGIQVYAFGTQAPCVGNVIAGNTVIDCVWGDPNPKSTLSAAITASATSISVVDGSAFSSPTGGAHVNAILEEGATRELVWITARSGNTLTVVRGQGGFSAAAFTAAATITELKPVINAFSGAISVSWNCTDNIVAGNLVTGSGNTGILLNGTAASGTADKLLRNRVEGNTVVRSRAFGIDVKAAIGGAITDNTVNESGWYYETGPGSLNDIRIVASDNADVGAQDLLVDGNTASGPLWSGYSFELNASTPLPKGIKQGENRWSRCWLGYVSFGAGTTYWGPPLSVLDFGANPASGFDNSAAFATALAMGGRIRVPSGTYAFNSGWGITKDGTRLECEPGVVLQFAGGTNTNAITVYANQFEITGFPTLHGPSTTTGTYVTGENGIVTGTNGLVRIDLQLGKVTGFGFAGVILSQATDCIVRDGSSIIGCGWIGLALNCCQRCIVEDGVTVGNIWPTSEDGYGILVGSNNDAVSPAFSRDIRIGAVRVYDVKGDGIANQGNHAVRIAGASTYNCKRGIVCSVGSASASLQNYVGNDCEVVDCAISAYRMDGSAGSYLNVGNGLVLDGSASPANTDTGVTASGNLVTGYGKKADTLAAISAQRRAMVVLCDNEVRSWNGVGINVTSSSGQVAGAVLRDMVTTTGETQGICVLADANGNYDLEVADTVHLPKVTGGVAALVGFKTTNLTRRPALRACRFQAATTPVSLPASGATLPTKNFVWGPDLPCVKEISLTGGTTNQPDLADVAKYGQPEITLVLYSSAAATITNFLNVPAFTVLRIVVQFASSTITINRANMALAGGANFTGAPRNTLQLVKLSDAMVTSSGYHFLELSRAVNS